MRTQLVLSALAVLVALTAATDDGYYGIFGECFAKAPELTAGTDACNTPAEPTEGSTPAVETEATRDPFTTVRTLAPDVTVSCLCTPEPRVSSLTPKFEEEPTSPALGPASTDFADEGTPSTRSPFSTAGPTVTCPCKLIELLYSLCGRLEGVYLEIFIDFLIEIQTEILCDSSFSEQEKLIQCVGRLQVLFESHIELAILLEFEELEGFGMVCNLFQVVCQLQGCVNATIAILPDVDEECVLGEIVANSSCTEEQKIAFELALEHFYQITIGGVYTEFELSVIFYQCFQPMFNEHPEWRADFAAIQFPGFGFFGQFFAICEASFQMWTFELVIDGSVEECAFLQAIYDACMNESDSGVQLQMIEYYNLLVSAFRAETTIEARLERIMSITYSYLNMQSFNINFLYKIIISFEYEGVFCSYNLNQLLFLIYYQRAINFKCGLPLKPSGTPSLESTTTGGFDDFSGCNSSHTFNIFAIDSAYGDESAFTYSLKQASTDWELSCQNAAVPVIARCEQIIGKNQDDYAEAGSATYNYLAARPIVDSECTYNITSSVIVLSNGFVWGRVCDFAACVDVSDEDLSCPF